MDHRSTLPQEQSASHIEIAANDQRAPRRVLVVDDDDGVRRLLQRAIEQLGCQVSTASDGREALEALRQRPYDLMITDLRMPNMDGTSLVHACRSQFPFTGIMVVTGFGTIESAVEALKMGVDDYLTKPLVLTSLKEKVGAFFANRDEADRATPGPTIEPLVALSNLLTGQLGLYDLAYAILELIRRAMRPATAQISVFGIEGQEDLAFAVGPPLDGARPLAQADRAWTSQLATAEVPWYLGEGSLKQTAGSPSGHCLLVPLRAPDEVVGTLLLVREQTDVPYRNTDAQLLQVFGFQVGIAMLHARTRQRLLDAFQDLNQITLSAVRTLFAAIGTYDRYTHDHSERVAQIADQLAKAADVSPADRETIRIAGLLHDIGKLGVEDSTLHKTDALDESELDRIRLHPRMGARILADMPAFQHITPLVEHHHEHWDGSGYPDGLRGSEIPLGARILAIADSYDSMVSDRPYRAAIAPQEARLQILECAGSQFDPELARLWASIVV